MFKVKYGTVFGFIKYGEIILDDLIGSPVETKYSFTWNGISRKVKNWIKEHSKKDF